MLTGVAQNVVHDGLKTLHYLMTYDTNEELLLMIILCGQQELAARIERFPEVKSRMYPSALSALSRDETEELIKYRWQVASRTADNPLPFQREAIDQVFAYSWGLPREICKLCDLALLPAFADQNRQIDSRIIAIVAASLDLEEDQHTKR